MARYGRFTFLVNKSERELITRLAETLQRKEGDAVRFVIIQAVKEIERQNLAPRIEDRQPYRAAEAEPCKQP